MSSSSSTLTKFKTAITILTARFANSIFGGYKGSDLEDTIKNASSHGSYDPLIAGHMHDGGQGDGHAQKINLGGTGTEHTSGPHIRGELQHKNLADAAVYKNNVFNTGTETNSNIIPWRVDLGGGNYNYYLNLSDYTASVVGVLDLDAVATVGNKTDQKIMIGSDTRVPDSQLDIMADSSSYPHIKFINTDSAPSSAIFSMQNGTHVFGMSSKLDSYTGSDDNSIKIYPVHTSSHPSIGVELNADQGDVLVRSENIVHIQSTNASGTGIQIETSDNSNIEINSRRTSTIGPGINLETWGGSGIHIGTQTYNTSSAKPTEQVRFTAEQLSFHPTLRPSVSGGPAITSYDHENEFINVYDKANIDSSKKAIFTLDLGNKTGNSSNTSLSNNNAKIYLGPNAKADSTEERDSSIHIRDSLGPKIVLDDQTSFSGSMSGLRMVGQKSSSPAPGQYLFSEVTGGLEQGSVHGSGNYGGKIEVSTWGSKRMINASATSPYSTTGFASIPRLGIDYKGNVSVGEINRNLSKNYHFVQSSDAFAKDNYEALFSLQAETFLETDGVGNDMVASFSQTYSQDSSSSKIVKDLRYVEIEAPDFVNTNTSSAVVPQIEFYNLGNHTDGGLSNPTGQNFSCKKAAFMNFKHPVRDEVTVPGSYGLKDNAIDHHPMLLTNMSSPSYQSNSGVSFSGPKAMNTIPVSHSAFGVGTDAGYYADVEAWMKVFVDNWNGVSWEKKVYYVPMCTLRKR